MLAGPLEVSRLTLGHSGSSGCWQPGIPEYPIGQALLHPSQSTILEAGGL